MVQAAEGGKETGTKAVRSESLVDRLVARLRNDVAHGRLVPGQRLVESELTKELGVSRAPLRQALAHLVAEGILENERHRGVSVRRMARDDVRHLYRVREALEGQAAALAAQRSDLPEVQEACEVSLRELESYRESAGSRNYRQELEEQDRFHTRVADASANPPLISLIHQLRPLMLRVQFRGLLSRNRDESSIAEHEAVFTAIRTGDASAAERNMREHIRQSAQALLSLPDEVFR